MRFVIFCLTIACIFVACKKKKNQLIDPPTSINFSVEKINSENNFISEVDQITFKTKDQGWWIDTFGELSTLTNEIMYDVEFKNGEKVDFGFYFVKNDDHNKDEVILDETNSTNSSLGLSGNTWEFKDYELKLKNFYEVCEMRIIIDNKVVFTNFNSENVKLLKLEKAIVNGEEKTYAEFNFEGVAFGFYDPKGEFEGYQMTNGVFKGVIE